MKEPYKFDTNLVQWTAFAPFTDIRMKALQTYNDCPTNRISLVELKVEGVIETHKNEGENESVYILEGQGKLAVGNNEIRLDAGQGITIPGELPHSMVNTGLVPLKLLAIHTRKI